MLLVFISTASCGLPELSEHVTLTEERRTFPHGSKVTVECVHGYEPVDAKVSKTITCEETKWTELLLTCKKKYCKYSVLIARCLCDQL